MSEKRDVGPASLNEDLDLFVEHETLRVRIMEQMERLVAMKEAGRDAAEEKRIEKELKALGCRLNKLDRMDGKRAAVLLEEALRLGDRKLAAQLEALKTRYDRPQWWNLRSILDLDGMSKLLRQRIARGVSTIMLCGVIAMGTGQSGPGKIAISTGEIANREEIHEVSNISGLLGFPEKELF